MVRDKQLSCNREGEYSIFDAEKDAMIGTISAHPRGFGFVMLDEGGRDLRLSAHQMKLVFHGDRVKARMLDDRGDSEVVEILESLKSVVGRLHFGTEGGAYVVVDDKRICNNIDIPQTNDENTDQQIVIVEIIQAPTFKTPAQGKITRILGDYMDEGVETEAALYRNGIPVDFSGETLAQTKQLPTAVSAQDKIGRVDITDMKLVTIDGEDSRDFDDAVFAESTGNGWKLVVAIADVSHYVEEGTALDIE
jgi:ribonuclease R